MTVRAIKWGCLVVCLLSVGCNNKVGVGANCFDSQECSGGVCAETVYGNVCLVTCSEDTVFCEETNEPCLEGQAFEFEGSAGAGGDGLGGASGMGGAGGMGGAEDTGLFACLPGNLDLPGFEPVLLLGICTVSLDCEFGGACICLENQNCDLSDPDRNGPVCLEVCDPARVSQCPAGQSCADLGNGRGFCDPATTQPI